MKIKKSELKALKGKDLAAKLEEVRKEYLRVNSQVHGSAAPKNIRALKNMRRTIARLLTIQNQEVKE